MEERELSTKQVSLIAGVTEHTIINWTRNGLKGRRNGFGKRRNWLFKLSDVKAFLLREDATLNKQELEELERRIDAIEDTMLGFPGKFINLSQQQQTLRIQQETLGREMDELSKKLDEAEGEIL